MNPHLEKAQVALEKMHVQEARDGPIYRHVPLVLEWIVLLRACWGHMRGELKVLQIVLLYEKLNSSREIHGFD